MPRRAIVLEEPTLSRSPLPLSGAPQGGGSIRAVAASTLRALTARRRLVPIVVLTIPLLAEQAESGNPTALGVGALLCASCVLVAPVSFRVLCADGITTTRVLAYAALGALVVLAIGAGLPFLIHLRTSFLTTPTSLAVVIALYCVGGFGLARDIDLEGKLLAQRARAEALAREAERSQLLALRAHLDPHFIFNTLNAIAEWCRLDGEVAEQAILRLAEMLRAVLEGVRAEAWPLKRELALVEALFELHRMRDPGRFSVRLDVDPSALTWPVPPLLLLPLAENAMKHGPEAGHHGEVELAITAASGALRVTLSNPGPYAGPRPGSDGLPTIERRLALTYGGRARLRVAGLRDRTRVELELPEVELEPLEEEP